MVVDNNNDRSRDRRGRSRSPAARSTSPQRRPLRKTQSTPVTTPSSVPQMNVPTTPSSNTEFSASFPDFGSLTSAFPPLTDGSGAFTADDFELFGHQSFPATSNHSNSNSNSNSNSKQRQLPLRAPSRSINNRDRRGRSHSPPRRTVSQPTHPKQYYFAGHDDDEDDEPTERRSWDEQQLEQSRRKMSLLLGDENFPAADVSAFLGDFALSSSSEHKSQQSQQVVDFLAFVSTPVADFPGVDLAAAAAKASSKTPPQQPQQAKNHSKQDKNNTSPKGFSRIRKLIHIGAAASEHSSPSSPDAREKGELAQEQLKDHQRRQQLLAQPESQATSATSETSATTTSSPWDTQSTMIPKKKKRNSIQKLRNLVQPLAGTKKFHAMESMGEDSFLSNSLDLFLEQGQYAHETTTTTMVRPVQLQLYPATTSAEPLLPTEAELHTSTTSSSTSSTMRKKKLPRKHQRKQQEAPPPKPPTTTATKQSSSSTTTTTKSKTKKSHKKQPPANGKSYSDLPPLQAFQSQGTDTTASTSSTTATTTTTAQQQPMEDVSDMSLSLSDLQRSRFMEQGSSTSTATTAPSSSSMLSSSRSTAASNRSSKRPVVADSSLDQPVYAPASALYHRQQQQQQAATTTTEQEDSQQHRSSTATMLDSLALDTVHETLNEESTTSRHSTATNFSFIVTSSPMVLRGSPPSSFSSKHSGIPEDSPMTTLVMIENPPFADNNDNDDKPQQQPSNAKHTDDNKGKRREKKATTTASSKNGEKKSSTTKNDDKNDDDDGKSRGSRKSTKSRKKRSSLESSSATTTTRRKEKTTTNKSRGEDVANRRPDRHSTATGACQEVDDNKQQQRRRRSIVDGDASVEKQSRSMNDVQSTSRRRRRDSMGSSSRSSNHHKSDRHLRSAAATEHEKKKRMSSITAPCWEESYQRGDSTVGSSVRRERSGAYEDHHRSNRYPEEHHWEDHGPFAGYTEDAEMAFFRYLQRRMIERHGGGGSVGPSTRQPFPFSDHVGGYCYPGPPQRRDMPSQRPCSDRLFWSPYPDERDYAIPHGAHNRMVDGFPKRGVRRRHSLSSGHSRDSIVDEISHAMEREYRVSTCGRCGHVVSRCHCQAHHRTVDSFIGDHDDADSRSHHSRGMQQKRQARLASSSGSAAKSVSLFDTFGIKKLDTSDSRAKIRPRLDEEVHSNSLPSLGSVPLYHRPNGFDVNERLYSTRNEKVDVVAKDTHLHRGRRIRGHHAMVKTPPTAKKGGNDEDCSLRYPPRMLSPSSSGRTIERSYPDDESLVSFAI
ncbi:expressed unknown protein [Seminavis robusta]|uniref:Uncharacterized protein n=1 Tax=Seminavis robusta TaxID=568900 RepID=A0A9N8HAS7_9STRA|nr:expressed unknown protein [Seminavis robusta]|eukprot:Sro158_g071710.1 n/a (1279) ;mRNA; f:95095-98931